MNDKKWESLDFNVASDYTYGSPEYHRTMLRQNIGLPNLLPGEKSFDHHKKKRHGKRNFPEISFKRFMQSDLFKGKR